MCQKLKIYRMHHKCCKNFNYKWKSHLILFWIRANFFSSIHLNLLNAAMMMICLRYVYSIIIIILTTHGHFYKFLLKILNYTMKKNIINANLIQLNKLYSECREEFYLAAPRNTCGVALFFRIKAKGGTYIILGKKNTCN